MVSQLISCQSINNKIWRDIHCFLDMADMENVYYFQMCLRKDLMHQIQNAQWSIFSSSFFFVCLFNSQRQEHQSRNCYFPANTCTVLHIQYVWSYIYIDKTIHHLSLRMSRLKLRCYLAGVLISQSKCCLRIPRGCNRGGWDGMEGEGSDSDVPPSISWSWWDRDNAEISW